MRFRPHLALVFWLPFTIFVSAAPIQALALTVNTTNDLNDGNCNAAHCSLREAIIAANTTPASDTIGFNIAALPPYNIRPTQALPDITAPVVIDGTTEPDFAGTPVVVLDGIIAGAIDINGLKITGGGSTVRGLVIQRFSLDGIHILNSGNNVIEGNYLGTDVTGSVAQANGRNGLWVWSSANNQIGGTTAAQRNVISGNQASGLTIASFNNSAQNNTVQGNYIGTASNGVTPLGNGDVGAQIATGSNNLIGGLAIGASNVISNNGEAGVSIAPGSNNVVQGNLIGVTVTGTGGSDQPYGVLLSAYASGNTIGGTTAPARNIISGNDIGVYINNGSNNVIQGNYIGADVTGVSSAGNTTFGVSIRIGSNNLIGGNTPEARNIISGNGDAGVDLVDNDTENNVIAGNYIGTDISGINPLPNGWGILIQNANSNVVNVGNVISSNSNGGIYIVGPASLFNRIEGNLIGTDATGNNALGNQGDGIFIDLAGDDNTIGGTVGNTIAYNYGNGISIRGGSMPTVGIGILGNTIYSNAGLGIDLGNNGLTANDSGDGDTGVNGLQNFPVLTSAVSYAHQVTIEGTLDSTANMVFRLEFFVSSVCDLSGNGEGQQYLGSVDIMTDGNGDAAFNAFLPGELLLGEVITATATDPANNTSEFSACVTIIELIQTGPNLTVNRTNDNNGICTTHDCSLREAILSANETEASNVITFDIAGDGIRTIQPSSALPTVIYPVTIDGTTQAEYAGSPLIELDGSIAGANTNGLFITAGDSMVKGLVINRFTFAGIALANGAGNTIIANYIGTNSTGLQARGNRDGIYVFESANNVIGGTAVETRNLISGNNDNGINLEGLGSSGNLLQGNWIGVDITGDAALSNGDDGIKISDAPSNIINQDNRIAFNISNGIRIVEDGAVGNQIASNAIYLNGLLGIDLAADGVTTNDIGDSDNGPNLRQNFPILNNAIATATAININGLFNSMANSTFHLEFFTNSACAASGQLLFGSEDVTTGLDGNVVLNLTIPAVVESGQYVTTTATDSAGNTSEFSNCIVVIPEAAPNDAPRLSFFVISPVLVTWAPITWATGYELEVDDEPNFELPLVSSLNEITATTLSASIEVPDDGVYYWRVRAKKGNTTGNWSMTQSFVVDGP